MWKYIKNASWLFKSKGKSVLTNVYQSNIDVYSNVTKNIAYIHRSSVPIFPAGLLRHISLMKEGIAWTNEIKMYKHTIASRYNHRIMTRNCVWEYCKWTNYFYYVTIKLCWNYGVDTLMYLYIPDYTLCVSQTLKHVYDTNFKKVVFGIIYYVENDYILL